MATGLLAACTPRARAVTTPSGLRYTVLTRGDGPAARRGQRVSIHETTTLPNGAVIHSSRGGRPITFVLSGHQVIAGVDEGVTGMRVGERLLVVPPALSRRSTYPPNTPPDATLLIDVRLMAIRPR